MEAGVCVGRGIFGSQIVNINLRKFSKGLLLSNLGCAPPDFSIVHPQFNFQNPNQTNVKSIVSSAPVVARCLAGVWTRAACWSRLIANRQSPFIGNQLSPEVTQIRKMAETK
ncbi:unnamed protein product [Lactuca saligna]|uniref:Uncharacterized protein n=1 Tax=Lactuca saligna TaxID=75948 RepID=A0AA35ZFY5_LACSI|nr:unnamed protein product [Lactuca saligna]